MIFKVKKMIEIFFQFFLNNSLIFTLNNNFYILFNFKLNSIEEE